MSSREFAVVVDQPTHYRAQVRGQLFYDNSLLVYRHLLEFTYNARFGFGTDEDAWQQHVFAFGLAPLRTNGSCTAKKTLQLKLGGICKTTIWRTKQVIEYIGRYSHKIAISNDHIKNIGDGKVSFTYKDYAARGVQKLMTLDAHEFLRRFCMYVLPKRFVKIRHYGFLSSRNKHDLKIHQMQIGVLLQVNATKTNTESGGTSFSQNTYRCLPTGQDRHHDSHHEF